MKITAAYIGECTLTSMSTWQFGIVSLMLHSYAATSESLSTSSLTTCFSLTFLENRSKLSLVVGTQQDIGTSVLERLNVPLPPLPEQQRIAAYLDASCAAIDAAVAAKRRQLETLDALRKAHHPASRHARPESHPSS